jgi:hypothetical protein
MTIKDRLNEDLKTAMKDKNAAKRDALRTLLAAIKQVEIDKQTTLADEGIITVLMGEAKKRREAIENFEQGGRTEDADKERFELQIVEAYLPQQMSEAEIRAEVEAVIKSVGATSAKDKAAVMKELMPKVKGKADGKLVNEVVTQLLNQLSA